VNKAASQLEQDLHHSARGKEYEQGKSDKNGDGTAVILTKPWVNDFFIVAALAMSTFHHIDNDYVRPFYATVRRDRHNDVFASDSLPAVRANTAAPAVKYCRPRSQILPPPQSNAAAPAVFAFASSPAVKATTEGNWATITFQNQVSVMHHYKTSKGVTDAESHRFIFL
jgi:hypothetical protein